MAIPQIGFPTEPAPSRDQAPATFDVNAEEHVRWQRDDLAVNANLIADFANTKADESLANAERAEAALRFNDLGVYVAGLKVENYNDVFTTSNGNVYIAKSTTTLPFTATGSFFSDSANFDQLSIILPRQLDAEISARQVGDQALQSQIDAGVTISGGQFSVINKAPKLITNSVTITEDSASCGPFIKITDGAIVSIANNVTWRIW